MIQNRVGPSGQVIGYGIRNGEIGGAGKAGYVGIVRRVHRNAVSAVDTGTAKVG